MAYIHPHLFMNTLHLLSILAARLTLIAASLLFTGCVADQLPQTMTEVAQETAPGKARLSLSVDRDSMLITITNLADKTILIDKEMDLGFNIKFKLKEGRHEPEPYHTVVYWPDDIDKRYISLAPHESFSKRYRENDPIFKTRPLKPYSFEEDKRVLCGWYSVKKCSKMPRWKDIKWIRIEYQNFEYNEYITPPDVLKAWIGMTWKREPSEPR